MKILLDHNLPAQLKLLLPGHSVFTARELLWDKLKNGQLLALAEEANFTVMVTGDQNLSYQQNNVKRMISLVVLTQISRKLLTGHEHTILQAMSRARPGSYELVSIPGRTTQIVPRR